MKHLFGAEVDFVESDVNPDYGHRVVDLTTMDFDQDFDLILCVSVLEHVPNFWEAPHRMWRALRPGGTALVSVPMAFPYHDEPHDYWRFTAHGMRQVLAPFDDVVIRSRGARRLPVTVLGLGHRRR